MTNHETRVLPGAYKEEKYQTLPLSADDNTNKADRHADPQQCRARMICEICGTYDDFIYEELSPENGWKKLGGQSIYECMSCSALYTTDDALPENGFASAWLYWTSKEAAISHLSWIEHQFTQANQEIMTTEPSTVYEVASQLTKDGFSDSQISVKNGVLSIALLRAFRKFEDGRYADSCRTNGFAFKSEASDKLIYSVRLHIASHPYSEEGEPDITLIQEAAASAPATLFLNPQSYAAFLKCVKDGADHLEAELDLASARILERIDSSVNSPD